MNKLYILTKDGKGVTTEGLAFIRKTFLKDPSYKVNLDDKTVYLQGDIFNDTDHFTKCVINDMSAKDRCFVVCSNPDNKNVFFMDFDAHNFEVFKNLLRIHTQFGSNMTTWEIFEEIRQGVN